MLAQPSRSNDDPAQPPHLLAARRSFLQERSRPVKIGLRSASRCRARLPRAPAESKSRSDGEAGRSPRPRQSGRPGRAAELPRSMAGRDVQFQRLSGAAGGCSCRSARRSAAGRSRFSIETGELFDGRLPAGSAACARSRATQGAGQGARADHRLTAVRVPAGGRRARAGCAVVVTQVAARL